MKLPILFGFLAYFAVAQCYTCPDDNNSSYFVDVAENCTMYYYCNGSELRNFSCPEGKMFDILTETCQSVSDASCLKSYQSRQKHSAFQVHSISIEDLKTSFMKMEKTFKSALETSLEEIAPSITNELKEKYIPFVLSVKAEVMPFVKEKILPEIKKAVLYAKQIGLRVADKIHHSIELSNSTHINIVSFSDIMSDISKDSEPFLRLGKFVSTKALHGARIKRQAYYGQQGMSLPEAFITYLDPFVARFIPSARNMMIGNEYTVKNKVILPIVFDMLQDPQTRRDLIHIFFVAKNSFGPLAIDMFMQQPFGAPRGSVVQLSKNQVLAAKMKFTFEGKPLLIKVALKYLPVILRRCLDNAALIMQDIDKLKQSALPYIPELKLRLTNFMAKHGSLLLSSTSTHINTYSLMEIKSDLKPIGRILLEIFMEKMSREPNNFLSSFFNRNSVLYSILTAGEPPMNAGRRATDPRIPALRRAFSNLPQIQRSLMRG